MEYDLFSRFAQSAQEHAKDIACQINPAPSNAVLDPAGRCGIKDNNGYAQYTYSQLYELTLKVAAFLTQEGLARQERVAILLENSIFWPAAYFGIIAMGATAVPLDTKLTPYEINNILRDCQAKILFTSDELYRHLEDLLKNILSFKKAVLYPFSEITQIKTAWEKTAINKSDDIASLLYTSGTTASPKGVMLSHRNFCSNFEGISKLKLFTPKDNIISLLPLHHSYPFMITLILPLLTGAKITFLNSLKSEDMLRCMRETQGTILVGVPQLFHLLHKAILEKIKNAYFLLSLLKVTQIGHKLLRLNLNKIILKKLHQIFGQGLRFFASGGAHLEPKVARELTLLGFTILEGYGLTETSPVVTFNPPQHIKFGSVGIPIPEVKIKINNPNTEHIGEVLIQGPNVMKGYYKKPKETAEVLKDGWFYSGDLGYIDKSGYLFLTGRSKEVIVLSSGKNIYPEEIEAHYLKSPYIKEICVLEIAASGLSSLQAIVLPNIDYFRKTKEINIQGKIRWLLENLSKELPSYKRIMGFSLTQEELPKTRLGKLKRYEIKTKYLAAASGAAKLEASPSQRQHQAVTYAIEPSQREFADKILQFLSRELKTTASLNDHLELDLGIDSLSRVELTIGLEKLLNIQIPDTQMNDIFTIKELIERLSGLLNQNQNKTQGCLHQPTWAKIIQETPRRQILDKINLNPSILDKILTLIILNFIHLLLRILWRLKVEGKKNLPRSKPYIICPNHSSYLDGFAVAASLGFGQELNLFFLGYSGYFQHPLSRWAVKIARLIAIDPAQNLTDAMQASALVLRNKKSLCIFPEGERSIDEKVKNFKKGVGILIKETNCLVVPCQISGSYQAWPRGKTFPWLHPIKVIFGKPYTQEELKEAGSKYKVQDDYEAIALGLREKVIALSRINRDRGD